MRAGLFYLDWLMDHRKDFQWLVLEKLGEKDAEAVDWSAPRLVCIAGDFKRYDDHAVKQIQRWLVGTKRARQAIPAREGRAARPTRAVDISLFRVSSEASRLRQHLHRADPLVRAAAQWSIGRLKMTVSIILAAKGRDVVTIEPSASLAAAAKLLAEKRIGAVLILGADRLIVGILSERESRKIKAATPRRRQENDIFKLKGAHLEKRP
jgi:hypothetical protein